MTYTATYSPDDNKLRLYSVGRLPADVYARVREAGFRWAPKQELFVAPAWTPGREDLLLELAGEVGDEDTSLADRAEQRADRFDEYSEKRSQDADVARKAVSAIADNIPLGQPILVGHHSERHARRDAEKIENGMRRAVKMWETSKYWTSRAAGAIAHAKYKERPDVRARRIKTIEADRRKQERNKEHALSAIRLWETLHDDANNRLKRKDGAVTTFAERALWAAGNTNTTGYTVYSDLTAGKITPEQAQERTLAGHRSYLPVCERWLAHLDNRLAYERAMLQESGYVEPPKAPTKAALPLLNYPGTVEYRNRYNGQSVKCEAHPMAQAEYAAINRDYKGSFVSADGTHRVRSAMIRDSKTMALVAVYLTDAKQHTRPGSGPIETREQAETAARIQRSQDTIDRQGSAHAAVTAQNRAIIRGRSQPAPRTDPPAENAEFEGMKDTLAAGIEVISAPQLFPTPPELAARAVALADIQSGQRVLEPSAGTGALLAEIEKHPGLEVVAVEINAALGGRLKADKTAVVIGDFLACQTDTLWGPFDRVVMNPPFADGADIKHIRHALGFLKPGGRLVAICANGPRQREQLQPLAEQWIDLGPGSFKQSGTNVNAAMLIISR